MIVSEEKCLEFEIRVEGVLGNSPYVVAGKIQKFEKGRERDGVKGDLIQVHVIGVNSGGVLEECCVGYDTPSTHTGDVHANRGLLGKSGFHRAYIGRVAFATRRSVEKSSESICRD